MMWLLSKLTLESIIIGAEHSHPKEFMALLGSRGKNKVIDELVFLPVESGEDFASIRLDLLPFDGKVVGSVHSHPGGIALPSRQDIETFPEIGKIHFIIAEPYSIKELKAFDVKGERLEWGLLE